MAKPLPLDDFRAVRIVMEPDDFALGSDEPEPPPSDVIPEDTWHDLTTLPDDVAVRTSNHHGTLLHILNQLAGTWPEAVGDSEHADAIGLAMIELINEPDAALYMMLVGFYRQAIDSLRIMLESVTFGAYCQLGSRDALLNDWLNGSKEISFNEGAAALQGFGATTALHGHLRASLHLGLADQADRKTSYPGGWLRQLYQRLSRYSHGRPLFNNPSLWESNGPIYVPRVIAIFAALYIETFVASYVLVKCCRPSFELPREAQAVFDTDGVHLPAWAPISDAAREAFQFVFSRPLQIGV